MASIATKPKVTKKAGKVDGLVINQIQVRSVDRSRKDIETWLRGLRNAESIEVPNKTPLYDVYETVILDGHLSGIIEKRVSAVVNKTLRFKKKDAEVEDLNDLIRSTKFRNLVKLFILTELWGESGIEFIPGPDFDYNEIPRKHIKSKWGVIATEQNGHEGTSYEDMWNIWILGEPNALGLLLKCAPYALYKKGNTADWAQYIELFGQPFRIVKYDAHDEQTKAELKVVLDESGGSQAIMIPKQAEFDIKDGKQSNGDGKLQATFMDKLNDEMSVLVLGNTETTGNSNGGSYAKSKTQQAEQLEITKSDLIKVENLLNTPYFLDVLKSYGYQVDGGRFEWDKEVDLAKIKSQLENIRTVKSLGTPVDDDYIYEVSGIPKPKNYEELKKKAEEKALQKQKALPGIPEKKANKGVEAKLMEPYVEHESESLWDKLRMKLDDLRMNLADFFAPAPKD